MKIFYDPKTGEIYYAIKEVDWAYFTHTTNIPLELAELPETEDNRQILADVWEAHGRKDKEGRGRFFVEIEKGEAYLVEREGWEEKIELPFGGTG